MSIFARIHDGIVVELVTPPAGVSISDMFHANMDWVDCTSVAGVAQGWTYDGTNFATPVAPAPSADQVLSGKISAGISITSTGTPALDAVFALDDVTMTQIGSVARDSATGLGLPGGASTFTYPDATGTPRTFTGAQIEALYKAQRDLLFALQTQAAIMHAGGSPVWPAQTATIA